MLVAKIKWDMIVKNKRKMRDKSGNVYKGSTNAGKGLYQTRTRKKLSFKKGCARVFFLLLSNGCRKTAATACEDTAKVNRQLIQNLTAMVCRVSSSIHQPHSQQRKQVLKDQEVMQ